MQLFIIVHFLLYKAFNFSVVVQFVTMKRNKALKSSENNDNNKSKQIVKFQQNSTPIYFPPNNKR